MKKILIFGGTTEGRQLAEYCHKKQIEAIISVTSEYGEQVLFESPYVTVSREPLSVQQMEDLIKQEEITLVIDATHPYATVVTKCVQEACSLNQVEYIRLVRELDLGTVTQGCDIVWVDTPEKACSYLAKTSGNILLTTGSKNLLVYTKLEHYLDRLYVRVLPCKAGIEACENLKITGKHMIAMQGPFSEELNIAMLHQIGANYLVTKEAGNVGGFREKVAAANKAGVKLVVIGRPVLEEGKSLEEIQEHLRALAPKQKRRIYLIGIGMGGKNQLTVEAAEQIASCDALLGAPRMLESIRKFAGDVPFESCYLGEDVVRWLEAHKEYAQVGVVFSGDTGFYSGSKKLVTLLECGEGSTHYEVHVIPGISTVAYLCSQLKTTWEDVVCLSQHGRNCDIIEALGRHNRIFLLLGGENSVTNLCKILLEGGYETVHISVGERLSYLEERICTGTPSELLVGSFDTLTAVLIEQVAKGGSEHEG